LWVRLMEYTKIKNINEYVSESVSPMNTPEQIFEMYSVPIYSTGHPEYLHGNEIASNKVKVRKNDVLLCKINPRINRVWIVADESAYPCIASSEWIVIRNSEYNPEFLAWYFRSPKFKQLMTSEATGIGGSLTRAQPKAVAEYPVPVIERQEQDVITEILNKIYNIIDARRREINILDDLIKARFVEMFGDPADISRKDKVELSEICEKITDGEHGSVARVPNGHPFLNAKQILKNGRIDWDTITYVGDEDHQRIYKRCNPVEGDILLTTTGTIGNVAIMPKAEEVSMDRGITLIKIDRQKVTSEFVAELLKQPSIQTEMGVNVHASAIGHLFMNRVKKLPAILPSMESQAEFTAFVRQVDKSKVAVQKSLDETQLLFNSLMQKYFG
jgi:type I restriction enzyme S subunit